MRPVPKEAKMNRAEAREPKSGHDKPGGKSKGDPVGNEKRADMRGALEGEPTDHNPLRGAVKELHVQHPHSYDDHGPHHGGSEHMRHESMRDMMKKG